MLCIVHHVSVAHTVSHSLDSLLYPDKYILCIHLVHSFAKFKCIQIIAIQAFNSIKRIVDLASIVRGERTPWHNAQALDNVLSVMKFSVIRKW